MIQYQPPKVIAEGGCNHMGSYLNALDMIDAVVDCGAWGVKFQKRDPASMPKEMYEKPYENEWSFGKTYGEHRKKLELSRKQHLELQYYTGGEIKYGCSVWDLQSAKEIVGNKPDFVKIPSQINTNERVLDYVLTHYIGEIHLSLGMTNSEEREKIHKTIMKYERQKDTVLFHCTSIYPCPFEYAYLQEIPKMVEFFVQKCGYRAIGFSNHCNGIAIDLAAYALGAEYFERHFTLNRAWKGTDQAWSLEPQGLKKLIRDLNNTYKALQEKTEMPEAECEVRRKFGKGD